MEWIASDGGPLICLGHSTILSWKGVDGLSEHKYHKKGYRNDYERACDIKDYLGVIPILSSNGIVLGDMPLDTTVLTGKNGLPLIARAFYSEPLTDIASVLVGEMDPENTTEVESVSISVDEKNWHIFDSAYPGYIGLKRCLSIALPAVELCVKTFEYKPDSRTFLLVHQFNYSNSRMI